MGVFARKSEFSSGFFLHISTLAECKNKHFQKNWSAQSKILQSTFFKLYARFMVLFQGSVSLEVYTADAF
jgi:hypothetical protein